MSDPFRRSMVTSSCLSVSCDVIDEVILAVDGGALYISELTIILFVGEGLP